MADDILEEQQPISQTVPHPIIVDPNGSRYSPQLQHLRSKEFLSQDVVENIQMEEYSLKQS